VRVCLMYKDRDFDQGWRPWNASDLSQTSSLRPFSATWPPVTGSCMTGEDVALSGLDNCVDIILYRQAVLTDCLKKPPWQGAVRLACDAYQEQKEVITGALKRPHITVCSVRRGGNAPDLSWRPQRAQEDRG